MWKLSSICIALFCADDLVKPHDSIWVVRMWCGMCTDPVRVVRMNYGDLLEGIVPEVSSWLTV
jgi:hypothetical protein